MNFVLSVVIVAYKSRDEIGPCLASWPTTLTPSADLTVEVEIVVVDNSPGDGAGELIRREFLHVQYLAADRNLGFGAANNLGTTQIKGDFVLYLNPDTVVNAAALEQVLRQMLADSSLGLISPKLVMLDGTMDLACRRRIPTLWDGFCRAAGLAAAFPQNKWFAGYNLTYLPENGFYEVEAINGAFMLLSATSLRAIAPDRKAFDETFFMYGDDLDLCIRMRRAGFKIMYDGSVQITHLKGVSVAKDYSLMSTAIFDANRDVYLKHFNPGNSRWVRWKFAFAFGCWKWISRFRARLRGYRKVRPM